MRRLKAIIKSDFFDALLFSAIVTGGIIVVGAVLYMLTYIASVNALMDSGC